MAISATLQAVAVEERALAFALALAIPKGRDIHGHHASFIMGLAGDVVLAPTLKQALQCVLEQGVAAFLVNGRESQELPDLLRCPA
eukprot:5592986-Heterocapsa_arctica.AAC.1